MSFQNRLAHFSDRRGQKLVANDISRSGLHLDVIHIQSHREMGEERRMTIKSFQFLPVVFPLERFEEMSTRYGKTADEKLITHLVDVSEEGFTVYVSSQKEPIDVNDLLFWTIENNVPGVEPAIMILRVKDMVSHFGSYGITHQGYRVTTESPSTLPDVLLTHLSEAHEKRQLSILAEHQREQLS